MAHSKARGSYVAPGASPKVAVIVAAYNVAETIAKAVTSALAQPETAEVVVVDDASEDHTHLADPQ